jgi:uncharacterized membrane protein
MADKKEKVYSYVSTIILVGSFCAAGMLILGWGMLFFHALPQDYLSSLVGSSFSDIFSNLFRGEPTAIINLGILLMMLTPFMRVVVAVLSFLWEKDFKYAAIAFGVMVILLFTILPSFI